MYRQTKDPHLRGKQVLEVKNLDLSSFPKGEISKAWVHVINNGLGVPIRIPIIVAKGKTKGKTLGLTAAVHGNELNGIPVIQKLFRELKPKDLVGNLVGVFVVNVPGILRGTRQFSDGVDLNRIAPGHAKGNESSIYINRILERIIFKFDYLIDLHTASFGRTNSYYIRADMADEVSSRMAKLQGPDIILNNPASDTSVRGSAAAHGIKSITIELRDPYRFQFNVIDDAADGIKNICYDFGLLPGEPTCPIIETVVCENSYWRYTDEGGLLNVYPHIKDYVKEGELIGDVKTIFGDKVKDIISTDDGIVIGKSVNPINQTGSRILHLGLNPQIIPCGI